MIGLVEFLNISVHFMFILNLLTVHDREGLTVAKLENPEK